jgi:hypothetical protein
MFGIYWLRRWDGSLNSAKYARMGLSGFSFTTLGDIMRGFETATNIDD